MNSRSGPPAPRVPRRRRAAAVGGLLTAIAAALALVAGCAGSPGGSSPGRAATTHPATRTASSSPSPSPKPSPTRPPIGAIGQYSVGRTRLTVTVHHARGLYGASLGTLSLPVLVRYPVSRAGRPGGSASPPASPAASTGPAAAPAGPESYPLVVFAPGYLQCPGPYSQLLRAWASAGFVVAAVTFPVTNCHVQGPEASQVDQPADVSYVITRLLAMDRRPGSRLAGMFSPREIAVAGHSDGADATIAIAGNACCRDSRVKAAVVLSGQQGPFPGRYFRAATPPMLFVQGSADVINIPATSAALYRLDTAGPRYYLRILGASHWSPYVTSPRQVRLVTRVTVAFLTRYLTGQAAARAAMTRLSDVPGFAHLYSGRQLPPA